MASVNITFLVPVGGKILHSLIIKRNDEEKKFTICDKTQSLSFKTVSAISKYLKQFLHSFVESILPRVSTKLITSLVSHGKIIISDNTYHGWISHDDVDNIMVQINAFLEMLENFVDHTQIIQKSEN